MNGGGQKALCALRVTDLPPPPPNHSRRAGAKVLGAGGGSSRALQLLHPSRPGTRCGARLTQSQTRLPVQGSGSPGSSAVWFPRPRVTIPGRAGTLSRRELLRPGQRARNVQATVAWRGAAHRLPRPPRAPPLLDQFYPDRRGPGPCGTSALHPRPRARGGSGSPRLIRSDSDSASFAPGRLAQPSRTKVLPALSFPLHPSGTHQAPLVFHAIVVHHIELPSCSLPERTSGSI